MNTIPLTKSAYLVPFIKAMEQIDCDVEAYLLQFKLPLNAPENPETLIPVKPIYQLANFVAQQEAVPDFGMLVAKAVPWHKVKSLAPLITNSLNLKDLLETLCKVASSQRTGVKFIFEQDKKNENKYYFDYCGISPVANDTQLELYRITSMIQFVQLATGSDWYPSKVQLKMNKDSSIEKCQVLEHSQVLFSQTVSRFAIPRHFLRLPVCLKASKKSSTHDIHNISHNFIGSLRQSMMGYLPEEQCNVTLMAELCGVSVRTLQRELSKTGFSYTTIIDQARYLNAESLLEDPKVKLIDVAYQLGYSDPAHFTRAFRRWSGVSPKQYRKDIDIEMNVGMLG
jgi:AraC-like DNA-binding protein